MKKDKDIQLRQEIGIRLKQWLEKNFSSIDEAGRIIGIHGNNLRSSYFTGKNAPGAETLLKLYQEECDIIWLLTGKTVNEKEADLIKENGRLKEELKQCQEYFDKIVKVAEQKVKYGKDSE